jgi:hypothetical protein
MNVSEVYIASILTIWREFALVKRRGTSTEARRV